MIELVDPEDLNPLTEAVQNLSAYAWILFTSVNAVHRFFQALEEDGGDARRLAGVRIAAIGASTAEALRPHGVRADLMPRRYQAEGLVEELQGKFQAGDRFLLPRAEMGREVLPEALRAAGAEVDVVTVYRTVCAEVSEEVLEDFREHGADVVTFTSSSTVENFDKTLGGLGVEGYKVASIGPVTSDRAKELGYQVDWEAAEATIDSLVEALVEQLGPRNA